MRYGLVVLAMALAAPASADISRRECVQLMAAADEAQRTNEEAVATMRQAILDITDSADDDEEVRSVLATLPTPRQGVRTLWEDAGAALADLCRDKL